MSEKRHSFETGAITVTWSRTRCIHAAACVAGLGRVFRPGEKPWIQLEHAAPDAVADVVTRCPTGALQFERRDDGAAEALPAHNTVRVTRNGPVHFRGELELRSPAGDVLLRDTRLALCRCGQSANKPLCDNAHVRATFRDEGRADDADAVQDPGAPRAGRTLVVTLTQDGPLQLDGPFVLESADGSTRWEGTSTWLCRCGGSRNKPFCDGSHETNGFRSG